MVFFLAAAVAAVAIAAAAATPRDTIFFFLAATVAAVAAAAAAMTRACRRLAAPVAPEAAAWQHAPSSLQPQWDIWWQTGKLPCPILHVLTGWASGSTIAWAEPVHISTSAHQSLFEAHA